MRIAATVRKPVIRPGHHEPLWTLPFLAALIVGLFINLSGIVLINVLPLLAISMGGNNLTAGTMTTLMTLSAFLARPLFGRMLDRKGRRPVLLFGLVLFAISAGVLAFANSITVVLAMRFVQGIGLSAYSTALSTVMSDVIPKTRIAEGLGFFGIAQTLSMAIGPMLGLHLQETYGFTVTFMATLVLGLVSVGCAFFIRYERTGKGLAACPADLAARPADLSAQPASSDQGMSPSAQKPPVSMPFHFKDLMERSVVRPCMVLFLCVIAISSVFSFMPLFAVDRNIDNIGLFFTVYALSMILSRLLTGKIADRHGHFVILMPALVLTVLMFLVLAVARTLPLVLLAAVFYGVGYGTVQPIMNTLVVRMSPPERLGSANATLFMFMDFGFGLGSSLWGAISQFSGFHTVFLLCAGCVVLAIATYFLLLRKKLRILGIH